MGRRPRMMPEYTFVICANNQYLEALAIVQTSVTQLCTPTLNRPGWDDAVIISRCLYTSVFVHRHNRLCDTDRRPDPHAPYVGAPSSI